MKISSTALAFSGWLTLVPAWADAVAGGDRSQHDNFSSTYALSISAAPGYEEAKHDSDVRLQKRPSFGIAISAVDPFAPNFATFSNGLTEVSDLRDLLSAHWVNALEAPYRRITLGYAWRGLKYESSALSAADDHGPMPHEGLTFKSASRRLSFSPSENWTFRLGRGYVSNLDQLRADDQVRRTAIAVTYRQFAGDADWQTTVAWGRSVRRFRERSTGYLLESVFQLQKAHSFFGRLEQVGSDDLYRENQSSQHPLFNVKKVTVGYFHDLRVNQSVRFDVGGLVSKHLVPSDIGSYGATNPTSFMMFVRLKLH